jgi:transposase-like protein/DDE family transposase
MIEPLDRDGIVAEVAKANFGDRRLNERLATLVRGLASDPAASLPSVFTSAELEGSYRFLNNVKVTPEQILGPHLEATRRRCAEQRVVRIVHDVTEFSYRAGGKRKGLGEELHQAFCGHFSLALATDESRRPLGLASLRTWVRGQNEEKEKSYWLTEIEATEQSLQGQAQAIHICDRGADDYVFFMNLLNAGHRFVVRAHTNRYVEDAIDGVKAKLAAAVTSIEHVSEREAKINGRVERGSRAHRKLHPGREPRAIKLYIGAAQLKLARPLDYGTKKKPHLADVPMALPINVVRVWEADALPGIVPIEWILFTSEPIDTPEQVCAIVDHYRARWTIEEYFKALKTGCAFGQRQLEDYEALINALAVFAPLAYQILLLRTVARQTPEAPASSVVSNEQLDVLRALGRRPLPDNPSARDVLLCIAALGGHIKYAPDPGWLTIARGYEKLEAYLVGWLAAKLQQPSDQR